MANDVVGALQKCNPALLIGRGKKPSANRGSKAMIVAMIHIHSGVSEKQIRAVLRSMDKLRCYYTK